MDGKRISAKLFGEVSARTFGPFGMRSNRSLSNLKISDQYQHQARGIADGLLYLHNQGVVHSDLKSVTQLSVSHILQSLMLPSFQDNILMSDSFSPLLADFGISRLMTSSSSTSSTTGAKGSARWMAFELLSPRMNGASGKHTRESDVWAYGMVVYVCNAFYSTLR